MKLSSLSPTLKRVLTGEEGIDWTDDDFADLSTDELLFVYFYGFFFDVMVALHERGVNLREMNRQSSRRGCNPWGDELLVVDEPLPPKRRDPRWPADCAGEYEYLCRKNMGPDRIGDYFTAEQYAHSILTARYKDLFPGSRYLWDFSQVREPAPGFATWAKTQTVPGLPSEGRRRDARGRFCAA